MVRLKDEYDLLMTNHTAKCNRPVNFFESLADDNNNKLVWQHIPLVITSDQGE